MLGDGLTEDERLVLEDAVAVRLVEELTLAAAVRLVLALAADEIDVLEDRDCEYEVLPDVDGLNREGELDGEAADDVEGAAVPETEVDADGPEDEEMDGEGAELGEAAEEADTLEEAALETVVLAEGAMVVLAEGVPLGHSARKSPQVSQGVSAVPLMHELDSSHQPQPKSSTWAEHSWQESENAPHSGQQARWIGSSTQVDRES